MAYYTTLTTVWNSSIQPPAGVTGTALSSGMTTTQKLATLNAWTVSGSVPTSFFVAGNQLLNCINWTEFAALTATQQSNILALCQVHGPLLGGSANTSFLVDGMIIASFPSSGPTIAALTALSKASVTSWCAANGYPDAYGGGGGITLTDLSNAGGLT